MALEVEGAKGQSMTHGLLAKEAGLVTRLAGSEPVKVKNSERFFQLCLRLIDSYREMRDLSLAVANGYLAALAHIDTCSDSHIPIP